MRIIRGRFKTRRYSVPKRFPSRPTTDFAKEGLFNVLENQMILEDLKILDLCAGTGNISVEFLSREAGTVVAVDKNYHCYKYIRKVSYDLGCDSEIRVIKADILKFLDQTAEEFNIIFADPPYVYEHHAIIAEKVFERNLLAPDGLLVIEHGNETSMESLPHFLFSRKYGNVHFSFFQKTAA
ncbi:MAG: 16S rRNA (guanine(966)-N(2))-methyltransferase RsmD [bacterium]|nr:16S rRNA (guanine(966)-N(2))-methyltransferase RsmD [bacterium]